ncbi:MAG TPA: DUF1987 domain-containing protein [Flavobacteriales bacterium]|nr:DUF1987 domain-containing protein [Flavobacteriales bacterium]HIO66780.1 DUF1987 domain-containing protein [Flavobacteriales bacterium]
MTKLYIEGTNSTPEINLDTESGKYSIRGFSYPHDTRNFYKPVWDWFEDLKLDSGKEFQLEIRLEHISSNSLIAINQILRNVRVLEDSGVTTKVIWSYDKDDEDCLEVGVELSGVSGLSFDFIAVDMDE